MQPVRSTSQQATPSPPSGVRADDVVDAAERLIGERGLHRLSVRALADELGVSRQVVYTHFGGMQGVFEALHLRSGRYLADGVRRLEEASGSDARLLAAGHAYVREARDRPGLFELTFGHPIAGYEPSRETTAELRRVFHDHIVTLVRDWLDANGLADRHDAIEGARVFWSAVHGLVTLERAGHARLEETDTLVDRTVTALLAGWRAASPGATITR